MVVLLAVFCICGLGFTVSGLASEPVFQGVDPRHLGFDPGGDAAEFLRGGKTLPQRGNPEVKALRIAQQYGLGYLPLMIMRQNRLIEKHAEAAGLGQLQVIWSRFPSGPAMGDALTSGFLDFAAGGVAPFLSLWDTSAAKGGIRAIAALESMPLYLNTTNPAVQTIADFGKDDRIALPAREHSLQAVILRMAVADKYGIQNYAKLDPLTVSLSHPQGMSDLLAGRDGITAHLTSPPYQYQELEDGRVRRVFSSYEVVGDKATFNLLWTRNRFYEDNPRTFQAVYAALEEAMDIIAREPAEAARVYILQAGPELSEEQLVKIITDPEIEYRTVPSQIMKYAEFMHSIGMIGRKPASPQELFFPTVGNDPQI
jgi:NitT/TauT family transport system substrate-binding protein